MRMSRTSIERRVVALACAAFLAVSGGTSRAQTQQPPQQPPAQPAPAGTRPAAPAAPTAPQPEEFQKVSLTAGRSTVLASDFNIVRIAVTNPAVADATVVQPREILIDGKAPGTISLIVWGETKRVQYDLIVEPPISTLQQNLQQLFPGEDIQVSGSEESTILSGKVSSTTVMLRAGEIAKASANKRSVINLLKVPGGSESQQVLLQV